MKNVAIDMYKQPQYNLKPDFISLNLKYMKRMYPETSAKQLNVLNREIIFAPKNFETEVNNTEAPIKKIRQNLADYIERDASAKNFIPYSLDTEIADLIENNNCETSSMNEYYRWIGATLDILHHTSDGDITQEDLNERKNFISMSYDRETEILLCLALYEGSGKIQNKEKINLLRFKLARLREMRSIVKNTPSLTEQRHEHARNTLNDYCTYCRSLLLKEPELLPNINVKLNIDIDHSNDEDIQEEYSHLDYLREIVLHMMHTLELSQSQNEHLKKQQERDLQLQKRSESVSSKEMERY